MNRFKILSIKEKNEIVDLLKKQFGIQKLSGLIVQKGKEKLFLFIGKFGPKEIKQLEEKTIIERIGIYFARIERGEIRLSLEGVQMLKDQITKNIFELNEEQANIWMHGSELNIATGERGYLVMKYKNDYLGCGKASAEKIGNFVPKSRRLKHKN